MDVIHQKCAGLDVHKETVVACAQVASGSSVEQSIETFSTTTKGLLALSEWLERFGCTHVAMEATGVFWKPVWHVLEGTFELVLANAMHVRNVPGRKTDVNDSMWLADLLAHGLIRGSFVPEAPIQEMRSLTRTRKQLVREAAQHTLRIHKTLEDANLKLASVVTDILGMTGRAILEALIRGEENAETLANLACGNLKKKREALKEALTGRVTAHHRFLLKLHLAQIDNIRKAIEDIDTEVGKVLEPFRSSVELLTTIPGISDTVAQVIVSEIGIDMKRFPTAGHLRSWAGLCPRNDESAGKRRTNRIRHGAPWLKTTLVQAAWAASRKRDGYFRAQFLRLKSKRGPKKAVVAVAASMLTTIYYMLSRGVEFEGLGSDHFERADKAKVTNRLVHKLQSLGYAVELRPAA